MPEIQALILTCSDLAPEKSFSDFIENELNIYSINVKSVEGGIKALFDGGPTRDQVFSEMNKMLVEEKIPRIVLVGHAHCLSRQEKEKDERELEVELRHVVSAIHAKFPNQEVGAYLNNENGFIKVV